MLYSPYKKPYITPPDVHPRLMVREEDVLRIQKNLTLPECKQATELWRELCQKEVLCQGATPSFGTYDLSEYLAVEAKALRALLSRKAADARAAIRDAVLLLDRSSFDKGIMKARWSGHLIFVCAEVYDWCYAFLTAEEKEKIVSSCETMAEKYFEMGYPPEKQTAISGHGAEAQLLRDLLALGIAAYDERPDIYEFCAGRIIDEYVPSYDFMFQGGFHHQGPAYGSYRYTCLLWGALLLSTMSGKRVFTEKLGDLAESFLYLLRSDGEAIRLGDDFLETKALYTRQAPFAIPMFFAWAYTGDERYKNTFFKGLDREYLSPTQSGMDYYEGGAYGEGLFSPTVMLLWSNLSEKTEEKSLLPWKYFGFPVGITVWNDGERVVLLKIGELCGSNHDHLDTGCFQIFCGGALASDSGVYDGYHTPHRKNYAIQTAAHNCLTVSDPQGENDGVRCPLGGKEPETLAEWQEHYRMATVLSHTEGEDGCRIVGDLSPAYSATCVRAVRTMCWRPKKGSFGVLTVEDEVETRSPAFTPSFHIHCQRKPTIIDGNAVIDNGEYSLICRVISPENAEIDLIGGKENAFKFGGVNYPPAFTEHTEAGWGQIVFTDRTPSTHKSFKVEMELVKNMD